MEAKQLTSEQEAVDQLRGAINTILGKRWMVAIWYADEVDPNNKLDLVTLLNRTTWHFPQSGFEEAERLLRENLEVEQKADTLSVPGPLEMAPFILPMKDAGKIAADRECRGEDPYGGKVICDGELIPDDLDLDNLPNLHLDDLLKKKQGDE